MVRTPNHDALRAVLATATAILAAAIFAPPAEATHFRYGHVTWAPRPDVGPRTVEFTVQNVWRRDAYGQGANGTYQSSENRCISTSLAVVNCTGPGGYAGVGDIIHETQGDTSFDFGDGSALFNVTVSGSGTALLYLVTSIDPVNNWLFGLALDHTSLPTIDTSLQRTYGGAATEFTAKIEDCCRISPCTTPNAHLNNPDNGYRVATRVELGTGNSSPVSSVPPIVACPQEGLCQFDVPVSDNELDAVSFRLSTSAEAHFNVPQSGSPAGLGQPGPPACPNAAGIDGGTGEYDWNTAMCRLAGSPTPVPPNGGCGNSALHSLYSTQVTIEETGSPATTAVDFLIELLPVCPTFNPNSPIFDSPPTPLCGTAQSVNPGTPLAFTVQASDADAAAYGDLVTLNAVGVPAGAQLSPALPTTANPVSSAFSWTPSAAQLGQHVITFTAVDQCGVQSLCSITVDVSLENCSNGIDDDGDTLADCADPDCNGTPCDDGLYCTVSDTCQAGACGAGPARNCGDGNQCTADACDEDGDQCVNDPVPLEGVGCDDGLYCTTGDACAAGACVSGGPRDCGDGNDCTADSCDEGGNQCVSDSAPLEGAACDDDLFCTEGSTCAAGACGGGTPIDCADASTCTVDSCDEDGDQCVNDAVPLEGTACDDGLYCTVGDTCQAGACDGAARSCDDGNVCTADACDEDADQCSSSSGPAPSCHKAGRSVLVVRNKDNDRRDRVVWRWVRGNSPAADFGDPVAGSTAYTLCIYDHADGGATPQLAMTATVQPGGTCSGGVPCWTRFGDSALRRLRYRDRDADGLRKLVLKPSSSGRAKAIFVGRGNRVPGLPAPVGGGMFNQNDRVRAQLVSSEGKCWEAEYTATPIRNRSDLFRDKCGSGVHPPCS